MPKVDVCEHWIGYSIPNDAAICPGCGRRHPVHVPPPSAMVSAVLAATGAAPAAVARPAGRVPRRHAPLVRLARVTRWLVALSAWALAAFGAAATARYVVGLDEVSDDVAEDVPARVGDIAHGIGLAAVALLVLAVAGAITWSRRAHANLAALEVTPSSRGAWSLGGWLVPGRRATASKRAVDELWRDTSPLLADLRHRGESRQPVSRVVLHWWTLWLAVPAAGLLAAALAGGSDELHDERALLGLAGAALAVGSARALYDVVGLVTVAQAHRAEAVLRDRAETTGPWTDEDDGWADQSTLADDTDGSEPLRR